MIRSRTISFLHQRFLVGDIFFFIFTKSTNDLFSDNYNMVVIDSFLKFFFKSLAKIKKYYHFYINDARSVKKFCHRSHPYLIGLHSLEPMKKLWWLCPARVNAKSIWKSGMEWNGMHEQEHEAFPPWVNFAKAHILLLMFNFGSPFNHCFYFGLYKLIFALL